MHSCDNLIEYRASLSKYFAITLKGLLQITDCKLNVKNAKGLLHYFFKCLMELNQNNDRQTIFKFLIMSKRKNEITTKYKACFQIDLCKILRVILFLHVGIYIICIYHVHWIFDKHLFQSTYVADLRDLNLLCNQRLWLRLA